MVDLRVPAFLCALAFFGGALRAEPAEAWPAGWGVDACISAHAPPEDVPGYIGMLGQARLTYIRERTPGDVTATPPPPRLEVFAALRRAGYRVVAFAELPGGLEPSHEWDSAPDDLLAVYRGARELGRRTRGLVDAWELQGEPDAWFSKDPPDRMMAAQKAAYLGLRSAGNSEMEDGQKNTLPHLPSSNFHLPPSAPPAAVLMGGLAHAPGPWLQRAARNGLYDYTDANNVHYYGHARDFVAFLRAHRAAAARFGRSTLPVWVTECGLDAVPSDDPDNAHAREMQRAFTVQTSRDAINERVAVLMQFIFVGRPPWGGHSLVKTPGVAFPAWDAYAAFTREHRLPAQTAILPPSDPCPVVLQWRPDYETCIPHKVSGTYWFRADEEEDREGQLSPMHGAIAIYNLSARRVTGRFEMPAPRGVRMQVGPDGDEVAARELTLAPFSRVLVPVTFSVESRGYRRTHVDARFVETGCTAARSRLWFGLETRPREELFRRQIPLTGRMPTGEDFTWIWAPEPVRVSSRVGPWLGVNGVEVVGPAESNALGDTWRFRLKERQGDPRFPPMAVTRIDGLPAARGAFLRVRAPNLMAREVSVRVDLVDRFGQRFTIAEELGQNRFEPDYTETFLGYDDLHTYAWGSYRRNQIFRPEDIREIQLRFYGAPGSAPAELQLDVVAPGSAGGKWRE